MRSTTAHKSSAKTWTSAPDVSDLEADRIGPTVRGLRIYLPVLAEFASLVSLRIGVDNSRDEIAAELQIVGVRAKMLLEVRLNNMRAITIHALHSIAKHPKFLEGPTRTLDEVLTGTCWGR